MVPERGFRAAKPLRALVTAVAVLAGGTMDAEGLPEFKSDFCRKREAKSVDYERLRSQVAGPANDFGLTLYKQIRSGLKPEENVIYSPVSAWMVLSMLTAGAEKETLRELSAVLGVTGGKDAFAKGCGDFLAVTTCPRQYSSLSLTIVNGLFRQEGKPFLAPFLQTLKSDFDAEPTDVNFAKEPARACKTMNDWVSDHTAGRIKDLVSEQAITSDMKLVLINAVRLKDSWENEFAPGDTKPREFFGPGGMLKVPMMHRAGGEREYTYADLGDFRAAGIPTASGEVDLIILLPVRRDGLQALEQKLNRALAEKVFGALNHRRVNLTLPKFKADGDHELVEKLKAAGLRQVFEARKADFSGMDGGADELFVSAIVQKAMIAVDEKGIEAAAATAAMMRAGSAPPKPTEPVDFVADHPFLYLVRHTATNALLFMGRITKPAN